MAIQKITPFLWFDKEAAVAAKFYTGIFKNSSIIDSNPMVTTFELEGQRIMALNGGPQFKLNESFSLYVSCENQAEIDYYWERLGEGSTASQCGWIRDQFGLWWQIVPSVLPQLMSNPERSKRVVNAFMKMKKMDIQQLMDA